MQAPLSDPRMELDPPKETKIIEPSDLGKTCEKMANDGRAKRTLDDLKITLEPYTLTSQSPEKKKSKKGKSKKMDIRQTKNDSWLRFLVMKLDGDESFKTISPFTIAKSLNHILGPLKNVRKVASGSLLVECATKTQSENALSCTVLCGFKVVIEPHKFLNYSRGVITCRDLVYATDQEIKDGMENEGVVEVKRFFRREGEGLTQTGTFLLTFNRPELPETVNAAYYRLKVRPYYPPPLRCFKCQRYGHTSAKCNRNIEICFCGHPKHESEPCPKPKKCPNCSLDHDARSKDCEVLRTETEIQVVRTKNKDMTYRQALDLVASKSYAGRRSYANVAEKRYSGYDERMTRGKETVATQTTCITPSYLTHNPPTSHPYIIPKPTLLSPPQQPPQLPETFRPGTSGTTTALLPSPLFTMGSKGAQEIPEKSDEDKGDGMWETPKKKRGWPKGKPRGSAKSKTQNVQTDDTISLKNE